MLNAVFKARGRVESITAAVFLLAGLTLVMLVLLPVLITVFGEDLHNVEAVLRDGRVRRAIWTTLKTATVSTALLALFVVPLAYAVSRLRFPGRTLLLSLIDVPIVVPQSVAGIALIKVFGHQQFIGNALDYYFGLRFDGTVLGICAAQVFVAMPFLAKASIAAFDAIPEHLETAARTLGASSWSAFRRVALPLASRGIFLGAVLAWARGRRGVRRAALHRAHARDGAGGRVQPVQQRRPRGDGAAGGRAAGVQSGHVFPVAVHRAGAALGAWPGGGGR